MSCNAQRIRGLIMLLAAVSWIVPAPAALAQADADNDIYRVGPGDVLRLNVPQLPSLDGELNVQADGSVYVPQVGELVISGLTLAEAEELLGRRLRLFDPRVTEVALGVVEYNALRIFALGAFANPGSHSFETPPTLWEVLRAAGGPIENANLAAARIITVEDGRPMTDTVDLSGYLSGLQLPERVLRGGDTLVVPTIADGVVGIPPSQGVQVFGGVGQPTTVPLSQPTEMITVLMLAGAPLETAELNKVHWVHRAYGKNRDEAQEVDMRLFLRDGLPAGNPVVYPGDVVYLPHRRDGWFGRNMPMVMTFVTTLTAVFLAYDRIENQ